MNELSVFVDESGDPGSVSAHYLLTLVFHDQNLCIDSYIEAYVRALRDRGLEDVPLHFGPLVNGNDAYRSLSLGERKMLLHAFRVFAEHAPFSYRTFSYRKSRYGNSMDAVTRLLNRDMVEHLSSRMRYFQSYDRVKIYYDDGQRVVTHALRESFGRVVARGAVVYRDASPHRYRMLQLADFMCGMELTGVKFASGEETATDRIFFGDGGSFRKNWLKKLRKKLL